MFDAVVIGGGFFGASLAAQLAGRGQQIALLEKEATLLGRASLKNQARIHGGYHYPRSYLTGRRSRTGFQRFVDRYKEAVVRPEPSLYAIARGFSTVSAEQFAFFCQRIGAPCREDQEALKNLFEEAYVEKVFAVEEFAFDANVLRRCAEDDLSRTGVQKFMSCEAWHLAAAGDGKWEIETRTNGAVSENIRTREVYIATYADINAVLARSQMNLVPLRKQWTEMALVELPANLRQCAVTVMDGPFWSCFPYPTADGLHTLSHVRYTPHATWNESVAEDVRSARPLEGPSMALSMIKDAQRFMPALAGLKYRESLWETKALLPRSAINDSRPILFSRNHDGQGIHVLLGAKIDNIFDILEDV